MTRKVNYLKLQAPYIELSKIREIADSVRIQNHKDIIPIKPDLIAEKLGFEIIPSTNLFRNSGNEAFLSNNKKCIFIDTERFMDDNSWNRSKFSIAHELGHFFLHKDFPLFDDVSDYLNFHKSIPKETSDWFERHADEFAGRLLVPLHFLESEIQKLRDKKNYKEFIDDFNDEEDYLSSCLSHTFDVNKEVIRIRLRREKLL